MSMIMSTRMLTARRIRTRMSMATRTRMNMAVKRQITATSVTSMQCTAPAPTMIILIRSWLWLGSIQEEAQGSVLRTTFAITHYFQ